MQAMKQLIVSGDFLKIQEEIVQLELLQSIGRSIHVGLSECLERLFEQSLSAELEDQVQEAIDQLQLQKRLGSRGLSKRGKVNSQMVHTKMGASNTNNGFMTF